MMQFEPDWQQKVKLPPQHLPGMPSPQKPSAGTGAPQTADNGLRSLRKPTKPPTQFAAGSPDSDPQDPQNLQNMYQQWSRSRDPQVTSQLLKGLQPTMRNGLLQFAGGDDSPALKSRAKILAIEALKTYDPEKSSLQTHVMNSLRRLSRIRRQQAQPIAIPERQALDYGRLTRASAELEDELGREPSDQELADFTGLSLKRISQTRKNRMPVSSGQMEISQVSEDGDSGGGPAVEITGRDRTVWGLLYSDLGATDQKIVEWTLGMNGKPKLTNTEIALRLRVSPGAVSQRKAKVQERFDSLSSNLWK